MSVISAALDGSEEREREGKEAKRGCFSWQRLGKSDPRSGMGLNNNMSAARSFQDTHTTCPLALSPLPSDLM